MMIGVIGRRRRNDDWGHWEERRSDDWGSLGGEGERQTLRKPKIGIQVTS